MFIITFSLGYKHVEHVTSMSTTWSMEHVTTMSTTWSMEHYYHICLPGLTDAPTNCFTWANKLIVFFPY